MQARRLRWRSAALVLLAGLSPLPPAGAAEAQLPNLLLARPNVVYIGRSGDFARPALRFSLTILNHGPRALDLRGEPGIDEGAAWQCVRWTSRVCQEEQPAGRFLPALGQFPCWRLEGAVRYELRRYTASGEVDSSPEGLVGLREAPQWFRDAVPDSDYETDPVEALPAFRSCLGPLRHGVSSGWASTYDDDEPGQEIEFGDVLADGAYALVMAVDPFDRLREANETDNVLTLRLRVYEDGAKVRFE